MSKYFALLICVSLNSFAVTTFFISDRPDTNLWTNNCPNNVCIHRTWLEASEIDFQYNFGYTHHYPVIVESPVFQNALNTSLINNHGRVVVFVHGYNVDFNESLVSLGKISTELDFTNNKATPLLFSWYSKGKLFGYQWDEEQARIGGLGLSYVLRALAKEPSVSEIHIIAHSMGNRVVVDALERVSWMLQSEPPISQEVYRQKLHSVSYFASDLNLTEHMLKTVRIHRYFSQAKGVVFYNRSDAALFTSKRIHMGISRAGTQESGQTLCDFILNESSLSVPQKVEIHSVDASSIGHTGEDILGHSYILQSPIIKTHLKALLFNQPFNYSNFYAEAPKPDLSALGGLSIKKLLGCEDKSWVLPGDPPSIFASIWFYTKQLMHAFVRLLFFWM